MMEIASRSNILRYQGAVGASEDRFVLLYILKPRDYYIRSRIVDLKSNAGQSHFGVENFALKTWKSVLKTEHDL